MIQIRKNHWDLETCRKSQKKIFIVNFDFIDCAEESYTGEKGTIDYPGGGNNYKKDLNCLFKISVPQGHHVDFSFSRFEFEVVGKDGEECDSNYDWLKFIDGVDVSDITKDFCNNGPIPLNKTFSSKGNKITLWMFSDGGVGKKGEKNSNM